MNRILLFLIMSVLVYGCSSTNTLVNETRTLADTDTVNFSTLLTPPEYWHHLDQNLNQFPGISSRLAYANFLKNKKPKKEVIVAVIDGGIDYKHEDLAPVMWQNKDEIPGNKKDDDNNGYIDDMHGWNFIGGPDGKNINHDTFELTRLYRRLNRQFADVDSARLAGEELEEYRYYQQIKRDYEDKIMELVQQYQNVESLDESMKQAEGILKQYFGRDYFTYVDVRNLEAETRELQFAKEVMIYVMENDIDSTVIADQKKQIYEFAKYGYNPEFDPRSIVGDNYSDKNERIYGNNDVRGPDALHGTHVAGIVAAVRNNGTGMDGVAQNTKIMAVRAVPNGDERDKDVANAIRYAVDNGADIINMSFGKKYSPYKEVVDQAIRYAESKGVLMIHGAGNESSNLDEEPKYPTPYYETYLQEPRAEIWISVGATSWNPEEGFVADFSNYGDQSVDLFAPGVDIYSTVPDNEYKRLDGTSMASPVVAGAAALIMAYYPVLNAGQVKKVLMESVVRYEGKMVKMPSSGQKPNPDNGEAVKKRFSELSLSDGIINIHAALKAADALSKQLSTR